MNTFKFLVKGVDFDFQDDSLMAIDPIADDFGCESYIDPSVQTVTYQFQNPYLVPMVKLRKFYENTINFGQSADELYRCRYVGDELYLSTNDEGAIRLSELGIDC
jgi:hypothetical protein